MLSVPKEKLRGYCVVRDAAFCAALRAFGFEFSEGTPKVSNVRSASKKYADGEPGEILYYIDPAHPEGINLAALRTLWYEQEQDLSEAAQLPALIQWADTTQKRLDVSELVKTLVTNCALISMQRFYVGRIDIDSEAPSNHETMAAQRLHEMPPLILKAETLEQRRILAGELRALWLPMLFAWIKCFIAHYREIRPAWKFAAKAVKFDRDIKGKYAPLVIPKNDNYNQMLKRWKPK